MSQPLPTPRGAPDFRTKASSPGDRQQPQEQAPLRSTWWALDQALASHLSATTLSEAHFKVEHPT